VATENELLSLGLASRVPEMRRPLFSKESATLNAGMA
jgi:hypothetical protein